MAESPKKRLKNFELALQDELMREFGAKEGIFVLDHLKMAEMFSLQSEAGVPVKFETLPLLGESCLDDVFGELFHRDSERCERVINAFRRAKKAHLENGGKQAAEWHACALNFNCGGEKECIAKTLMARGKIMPMPQQATDKFLLRNGSNGVEKR